MKGKIYTPDEANRMLPLVSRIADDIVATYVKVHQALRELEAAKAAAGEEDRRPAQPGQPSLVDRLQLEVNRLLDAFQGLVEEIESLGGTVKDYERGCIDFYGEVDGQIVYLCWQRGEESISHWHALDEGYANRHPIEVPHAA